MKLKSFFKRLILVEEVIARLPSSINGEISIYEDFFGRRSMRIGGVSQSGGLVLEIWKKAIDEIEKKRLKPKNCLLLGLGAGGFAKLVSEKWPEAKITGIEIDPMVIEIGKKYFKLGEIKNLKVVIADAIKYVDTKYDLILIDLCIGQSFPKEAEEAEFVQNLKKSVNEKGIIVFNRFYWGKYRRQAEDYREYLKKYFSNVWTKKTVSNLLIFCSQ